MSLLVTPDWLADRIRDSEVVILDATLPPVGVPSPPDVYSRYLACHLPGARFFDIEALSDKGTSLPHMLPSAERFSHAMQKLGVPRGKAIVVYEQEGVFSAPRAWWMLRSFGACEVCLLDGGLRGWVGAGLPTEGGEVPYGRGDFQAELDRSAVLDLRELRERLAQGGQVIDARSHLRFTGDAAEPRPGVPSGHMPGAESLPFTELLHEGRLKPAAELARLFEAKGLDLHRPIATTCGSGVTAAALAFGLTLCGARDVTLYDGSWAEYATQPDSVIATGP